MDIGDWPATKDLNGIYRQIRALGLETNVAELEAFGFTVIEGALSPSSRRTCATRSCGPPKARRPRPRPGRRDRLREPRFLPYLLFKDPVFKQSVLNPSPLALITYLLGKHCSPVQPGLPLEGTGRATGCCCIPTPATACPHPFTAYAQVANCNYALTDYTEAGRRPSPWCRAATARARQPTQLRGRPRRATSRNPGPPSRSRSRPARRSSGTAPPGTARSPASARACGSTSRATFAATPCLPQENYRGHIPDGYLEGEDPRLGRLLGADLAYGWTDEGPTKPFAPEHTWHA